MKHTKSYKVIIAIVLAVLVFLACYSYYQHDTGNTVVYCIVLLAISTTLKNDEENSKKDK